MYISKSKSKRPAPRRNIRADEEMPPMEDTGAVDVDPAATDLLFEAEDVADLLAEVTGEDITVQVDDDSVEFNVGGEVYVAEPDEGEDVEILESSRKNIAKKRPVRASRQKPANKRPAASRKITRR